VFQKKLKLNNKTLEKIFIENTHNAPMNEVENFRLFFFGACSGHLGHSHMAMIAINYDD
jgi:hypothetical protein